VEKFAAEPDDPHYQVQSIPATHTDMPKVVSNEDEGYQRLLGAIKHTYNHANKAEDSRQQTAPTMGDKAKNLNPSPPQVRHIVSLGELQHFRIIMTECS